MIFHTRISLPKCNVIICVNVPGGLTWGITGWNNDFFNHGGGPGIKYGGQGKLPPMLKDIVIHYFYLPTLFKAKKKTYFFVLKRKFCNVFRHFPF